MGEREKAKNQPSSFKMRIEATHTSLDLAGLRRVSVKTARVSEFKPPLFGRRDSPFCGAGVRTTSPSPRNTAGSEKLECLREVRMDFIYFFWAHCPHLVEERSEIKKREFGRRVRGVCGAGGAANAFS